MLRPNLKNLKLMLLRYNRVLRKELTSRSLGQLSRTLYDAEGGRKEVDDALELADKMLEGHGVEAIRGNWVDNYYGDIVGLYVNMGETWNATILYDTVKDKFYTGAWGDFVERNVRKYGIY